MGQRVRKRIEEAEQRGRIRALYHVVVQRFAPPGRSWPLPGQTALRAVASPPLRGPLFGLRLKSGRKILSRSVEVSSGTKNNSSIRWKEIGPPLETYAKAVGKTKSDIAREAVRELLSKNGALVPERMVQTEVDPAREILTVRWAGLLEPLTDRAIAEKASVAEIARRAVRYYLADMRVLDVKHYALAINDFGKTFRRIGGNLNQIALKWNTEDTLDEEALGQVHEALIAEFRRVIEHLEGVRRELAKQNI